MSIIGGKLKLKGAFQKKLDQEKKNAQKDIDPLEEENLAFTDGPKELKKVEFAPEPGSGRIITSATTVHGKDTKFQTQLKQGDFIIVLHPTTLEKEEREIMVALSDKSAALKAPFSSDLISFTQFEIRKKPEFKEAGEDLEKKFEERLESMSKKIKKPEAMLEYREKTGMWGYKNVKEKFNKELTREELLDMRAKKSRDKFCWI
jgi:hypothetical protein